MMKALGEANDICDLYIQSGQETLGSLWETPIDNKKDFQMYKAELLDISNNHKSSFSCDENIILRLYFNVQKRIPGVYGYLQFTRSDGTIAWVSDSNDFGNNKLERLPLGKSIVDIQIPKRSLGVGKYSVYLNFTSRQSLGIDGWNVDSPKDVCSFSIYDDRTMRGDSRDGYLSTLIDWKF